MTGYGHAQAESKRCSVQVVVKSLNSKYMDCAIRLPMALPEETAWRKRLEEVLLCGKVSVYASVERKELNNASSSVTQQYNSLLAQYEEITKTSCLDSTKTALFLHAIRHPIEGRSKGMEESDVKMLTACFEEALGRCVAMREEEGAKTQAFIEQRIAEIIALVAVVAEQTPVRDQAIADRLRAGVSSWLGQQEVDGKRLEEELFYYIEKTCFAEEIERLQAHISFFKETLQGRRQGKRLLFIAQEMVREMNTLGSKANDAGIQQAVVGLKTEASRIKEQLQNVL